MTDFPRPDTTPLFLSTWSPFSTLAAAPNHSATAVAASSTTWPVANTAFYFPVYLPWPYLVKRVFWINGTSVTSTNRDLGVYSESGARIYSTGSTAASGASATQYVTPTEFLLAPGYYYFALASSSGTASRGPEGFTSISAANCRLLGILQEASALPLPTDMSGSAVANATLPLFGITRTASGF